MLFIPGQVVSLLTFPGVIVHEIAHRFFADLAGTPVYKVCYFRLGNPSGYVIHGEVKNLKQSFLIAVGPLIVNTILCAVLTFVVIVPAILSATENILIFLFLAWTGFSIGMHAFPSNDDMKNFISNVKNAQPHFILLFFAYIFVGLLRIANALRVIWFDAIYAIGISLILPWFFGFL